jgi:hypothetical protein
VTYVSALLVGPLHLGLMQGAPAELSPPVTVTARTPFVETTACLAHLTPGPRAPCDGSAAIGTEAQVALYRRIRVVRRGGRRRGGPPKCVALR